MQINSLIAAGADPLSPVAVGLQRKLGNIVDYAHYVYSQVSGSRQKESQQAHTPLHEHLVYDLVANICCPTSSCIVEIDSIHCLLM